MEVPVCVSQCQNSELKRNAIAAYTRGDTSSQLRASYECLLWGKKHEEEQARKEREKMFTLHLKYFTEFTSLDSNIKETQPPLATWESREDPEDASRIPEDDITRGPLEEHPRGPF